MDDSDATSNTERAGFFFRPAGGKEGRREPRLQALAWALAIRRLGGSRPVPELGFAGETIESYAFSKGGRTILTGWTPGADDEAGDADAGAEDAGSVAAAFSWPDDAPVDVYATDRAYWESLWHRATAPEGREAASR